MNVIAKKRIVGYGSITVIILLLITLLIQYDTFLPSILLKPTASLHHSQNLDERRYTSRFKAVPTNETWCTVINTYPDSFLPPMKSDYSDWSFSKTVKCPVIDLNDYPKFRRKISLNCDGSKPMLNLSLTNDTRDVEQVKFGDPCLEKFIDHCCTDDKPVPNIIHHVLFGGKEFGFYTFLSFMSAVRFMKPCLHLIHGDYIPSGKYWDYFISISPNVIHVLTTPPTEVYGQKLVYPEHRADVLRIDVVKRYGGVYADWDEVLLKSMEPLRQYDCTMSELLELGYLGCACFMAKKNSSFIQRWREGYKDYRKAWGYNSQKIPYLLSQKFPESIHVEGHNFFKPGMNIIYSTNYNFSTNYGMHIPLRLNKMKLDLENIRQLNVHIGAICRHILFGNKDLCSSVT